MSKSKYDSDNIFVFDNEVLSIKFENQLITQLDMNEFITTDYSMVEAPGMVKTIRTYHGTGDVEDLDMGEGNTEFIGSNFTEEKYEVKTTQGTVQYYDEQQYADPQAIDKAIEHLSTQMTNDTTKKVVEELDKATNVVYDFDFTFGAIVRAKATMPGENKGNLFMLVNTEDSAEIQIALEDHLKYVESYVRSDYIGSVAGIPIYVSDAVESGNAYIATREAITCFMKKGAWIETERDAQHRGNDIIGHCVKVIALTNDDKVVKLSTSKEPETPEPSNP